MYELLKTSELNTPYKMPHRTTQTAYQSVISTSAITVGTISLQSRG